MKCTEYTKFYFKHLFDFTIVLLGCVKYDIGRVLSLKEISENSQID